MALNESFLQELKYKTDIEDVISSYVTLKKRGSTSVGLCPFHNEKTPSFTVYNDTQSFYCFGCGAGGDAVGFIRRIENLDYIDAVKLLAQRAGMPMPEENTYDDSLSRKRRKILEINRETAKFYNAYMMSPEGKKGREYFLDRGLTPNTIKHFGLGYAPDEWDALLKHLKEMGYRPSEMVDAGVVKIGKNNNYYDTFKNRVMTPIIDVRGNVIAFGGRVLDDSKPKYVNTSDTLVYKKTNELFGLNFAKDSGSDCLILCEGYMDVIAMHQAGFTNAVAGCGTALTPEQVRLISRYTNEVILAYDADEAGQKAVSKAVNLFKQTDIKIKIPAFSGGKDPDEIIKKMGRDKFKGMLEGASNEIEFAMLDARKKYNLNSTQGKIDFINDCIKILCDVTPVEQDLYLTRLSNELDVTKASIKAQLSNYSKRRNYKNQKSQYKKIISDSSREMTRQSYETDASVKQIKAEDRILGLLLKYPDCRRLCTDFDSDNLSSAFSKKVFNAIISRLDMELDIDLMNFSETLTSDELGRLSGIIARTRESSNPKQEFTDCISTICSEYDKKHSVSAGEMSDDDFRNLFKKNK
ncbi:MAG: DNA primase [Eubacteriales bacterium]|nr:DNA primase [Eubacteriales bacterium]